MSDKIWAREREILDELGSSVDALIASLPDDIDGRSVRRIMLKVSGHIAAADWILEQGQDLDAKENSNDIAYEQAREAGL